MLTRGPNPLEPPEAQPQTVPVGKRTALKVQEKVAPRRAGIRPTSPFPLHGREGKDEKGVNGCATTLESIGRIRRTQSG